MLLLFGCAAELPGTGMTFWQKPANPDSEGPDRVGKRAQCDFQGNEHLRRRARWVATNPMEETVVAWREDFCPMRRQWHFCLLPSLILSLGLHLHLALHFGNAGSPLLRHLLLQVSRTPLRAFHFHQRVTQVIVKPNGFDL